MFERLPTPLEYESIGSGNSDSSSSGDDERNAASSSYLPAHARFPSSWDEDSSVDFFEDGAGFVPIDNPENRYDFTIHPVPRAAFELTREEYTVRKFALDMVKYLFVAIVLFIPHIFIVRGYVEGTPYLKLVDAIFTTSFPPTLLGAANSLERYKCIKQMLKWSDKVTVKDVPNHINSNNESTALIPKEKPEKPSDILCSNKWYAFYHAVIDLDLIPSFAGAGVAAVLATLELLLNIPVPDPVNLLFPLLTTLFVVTRNFRAVGDPASYGYFRDVHVAYDAAVDPVVFQV